MRRCCNRAGFGKDQAVADWEGKLVSAELAKILDQLSSIMVVTRMDTPKCGDLSKVLPKVYQV